MFKHGITSYLTMFPSCQLVASSHPERKLGADLDLSSQQLRAIPIMNGLMFYLLPYCELLLLFLLLGDFFACRLLPLLSGKFIQSVSFAGLRLWTPSWFGFWHLDILP